MDEWATWCRLCGSIEAGSGNDPAPDIDIKQIMKRCFSIEIFTDDNCPIIVCSNCIKFSVKLEAFHKQCMKVHQMFTHLVKVPKHELPYKSLSDIRHEYEVDFINFKCNINEMSSNDHCLNIKNGCELRCGLLEPSLEPNNQMKDNAPKEKRKRKYDILKDKPQRNLPMEIDGHSIKEESIEVESSQHFMDDEIELSEYNISVCKNDQKSLIWNCPVCSSSFNKPRLRNLHLKQEHGHIERPFQCDLCTKNFPIAYLLKVHKTTHLPDSEKMVHKCPYCEKCFSKSQNVAAHIKYIHLAERNFICEECGKSYHTNCRLKDHYLTHSGERAFQCTYCPKRFKDRQQQKLHEDTHSGTSYECKICNKVLNTKKNLLGHLKVHSDEKKFKCHLCGNEYKRKKALKRHIGTNHMGIKIK